MEGSSGSRKISPKVKLPNIKKLITHGLLKYPVVDTARSKPSFRLARAQSDHKNAKFCPGGFLVMPLTARSACVT